LSATRGIAESQNRWFSVRRDVIHRIDGIKEKKEEYILEAQKQQ
jgi:hypothetical protein